MDGLKLLALDADDLSVVSAHLQDAVFKAEDVSWDQRHGIFSLGANRFAWEKAGGKGRGKSFERRRAVLAFKRVSAVRSIGVDRSDRDAVLSLLAISFTPKGEGPEGTIELVMAGQAQFALDVECIEAQLADTGGAWETNLKPKHPGA